MRFAGFDEEWEEKKFKDITKLSQGLQIPIEDRYLQPSNDTYFYITNEFLKPGSKQHYYIKNPNKSVIANKDDILMTRTGNTGKVLTDVEGAFHNNFFKIAYDNGSISKYYLFYLLNTEVIQNKILALAGSSTILDLNHKDFYSIASSFPPLIEQAKIGGLFRKIDALIEKQEGKFSKMEDFKKSMLQKMFPKKGELVPDFRFEDFDGDWEIKKIHEIASVKTGKSDTQDSVEDGEYPFYIRSDTPVKSSKYLYDEEAVLTIGDGQIGKVFFYVNGKYDLHQRVYRIFDFTSEVDTKYFYHYFSKYFLRRAMRLSAKGTVDSVRMEMITGMEIKLPKKIEEQIKIRNILENLDTQIETEEKLLESYKQMKKSLLQKMFV